MSEPGAIQPQIRLLSPQHMAQIHDHVLRLLAATGLRIDSERARQILAAAGASADAENRVRFPAELVAWALQAAPRQIDIYDRRGQQAFVLGDGFTRFGIGVTTLYYQDPQTDQLTPFRREHVAAVVRLAGALPGFDVVSTPGIVSDAAPEWADLYAALEMAANTTKPLIVLVSEPRRFADLLDLLEGLAGHPAGRPWVLPYVNPLTPLVFPADTTDKMAHTVERGLPLILSSYGLAGATTPISPLGSLIVLLAELLGGLVLCQSIRSRAPVVLGPLPAFFNMQGKGSFYDTSSYLLNLAGAEMMAWYGVPHCGTSGSGMGWGPDLITAGHLWMNHLLSGLGRVGLVPFVGDSLGSLALSPASIVYAHEVIAQARRLAQGLAWVDESSLLYEVDRAGPGGSFLMADSTLRDFRHATYQSRVFESLTLEGWVAQGQPQAIDRLRRRTLEYMAAAPAPPDHDELIARGEAWIQALMDKPVGARHS